MLLLRTTEGIYTTCSKEGLHNYYKLSKLIYIYVNNYQVHVALVKSVISMKDFIITTSRWGLMMM